MEIALYSRSLVWVVDKIRALVHLLENRRTIFDMT